MLKITNLSMSFGSNVVLKDFNYHFKPQTIYALMGANGSGKTTLFNLLSGFLKANSGEILFRDKDINNTLPHQIANIGIARTFQDMRLIPTLSVYDNILLAFKNKYSEQLTSALLPFKKHQLTKQIDDILKQTHLLDVKDSKASDISYGQQKLLNLAVALANDFELLLLDEPVAGVQPEYREQILQLIQSFNKTVIVIEHNPEFLEKLTENILFLDGGKIVADGNYQSIKENKQVQEAYL
jgi:ABC-type branched-subunit amino acid transport system ATPase component